MTNRNRFIGGLGLLALSAIIMVGTRAKAALPVAITLTIVGLVLVATSRRGKS